MKRFRGMLGFNGKRSFRYKNFVGDSWNYEDLKGNCRSDMESRYMKSSNQKEETNFESEFVDSVCGKKRNIGMSGERSVKRRVENYTLWVVSVYCFKDPIVQKGRRGICTAPSRMEGCSCELP